MESNKKTDSFKNESFKNNNDKNKDNINNNVYLPVNNCCLTNDEYIKLFYNSNNSGVNKNFPLKVIRETFKSKQGK